MDRDELRRQDHDTLNGVAMTLNLIIGRLTSLDEEAKSQRRALSDIAVKVERRDGAYREMDSRVEEYRAQGIETTRLIQLELSEIKDTLRSQKPAITIQQGRWLIGLLIIGLIGMMFEEAPGIIKGAFQP